MTYLVNRNKALMALQRAEIIDVINSGEVDVELKFKQGYQAARQRINALQIQLSAARNLNGNLREQVDSLEKNLNRAQMRVKRARRTNAELREKNADLQNTLERHQLLLQRLRGLGQPGSVPEAGVRPRQRVSL